MKLQRLHLKAFGAFSDRVLDLSGGKEGLHLIHGPNEAGKSTTLRAITQLLYGIDTKTSDAFIHPMQNLRIGGTLSQGGDELAFYRRKGNKATLLAADEKAPLSDDILAPFIGNVDLETFRNLFGLTHEQLVHGGQALVQGEGDVGQALFSAAAGMGNLRALLAKLDEDAGELFKPSASKPRINSARAQLEAVRKTIKAAQLSSAQWKSLDTERKVAEERREALAIEIRESQSEKSRLSRILEALPLVARRAELLHALGALSGAVLLPEGFVERRVTAQNAERNARETLESAGQAVARLQEQRDAIVVNTALLAREEEIERLYQAVGIHEKARNDVERKLAPELARLREEAEKTLHLLRPHWPLEQAEELRLSPGLKQRLSELDRRGQSCRDAVGHAVATRDKLQRQREQSSAELERLEAGGNTGLLEAALKRVHVSGASEEALRELEGRVVSLRQSIHGGAARLGFASDDPATLETVAVPMPETIERYRVELGDAARHAAELEKQCALLEGDLERAEAERLAYQRQHHAPSLDALDEVRSTRQRGWALARAAWEAATPPDQVTAPEARTLLSAVQEKHPEVGNLADAVATLVAQADDLSDRLRTEADRVAQRTQLESSVNALRDKWDKQRALLAEAKAKQQQLETTWNSLWEPVEVTPRSPAEMAAWRKAFDVLQSEIVALHETEVAVDALRCTLAGHRDALIGALRDCGVGDGPLSTTLSALIDHGDLLLTRGRERTQQRSHLEKTVDSLDRFDLPDAQAALARAQAAEEAWRDDWTAMMQVLGAPQSAVGSEAMAIVEAIEEILDKHARSRELQQRVDFILRDADAFREEVREIAAAIGEDGEGNEVDCARAMYRLLKEHRQAQGEAERLSELLRAEWERQRVAGAALAEAELELRALCAHARVGDQSELPEAERASSERQVLETALSGIEGRLLVLFPGQGLEAIAALVGAEDPDHLAPAVAALEEHIETLDSERLALQGTLGELKIKLAQMNGGSEAADAALQAQALIASIAEDAEEYARLRVAHFALNRAIEQYRAANHEPLLARAGELFQALTLGSFKELRADVDDRDRHVLLGVRAENEALVGVAGMSEGTADQLYLALRIASLERHLDRHAPVPFILDDILVNFDDARAAAALDVLAALSERTQVIYFTHHQHLVELAKAKVGKKTLFVHGLGG